MSEQGRQIWGGYTEQPTVNDVSVETPTFSHLEKKETRGETAKVVSCTREELEKVLDLVPLIDILEKYVHLADVANDPEFFSTLFLGEHSWLSKHELEIYKNNNPDFFVAEIEEEGIDNFVLLSCIQAMKRIPYDVLNEGQKKNIQYFISQLIFEIERIQANQDLAGNEWNSNMDDAEPGEDTPYRKNDDTNFDAWNKDWSYSEQYSEYDYFDDSLNKAGDTLIAYLNEHGITEVPFEHVVRLMNALPSALITKKLATYFESHRLKESQEKLVHLIQESKDEKNIDTSRRILYLLELGELGVASGVVEYLGARYTLAEADGIIAARRVSTDGKIGVYNQDGHLSGYFELGDFSDPAVEKKVNVLEISRALLFADPKTPDALRREFMIDYRNFFNTIFAEVQGVRMNDFTLREQLWVYQFWKSHPEQWDRFNTFKDTFGVEGVKTFVSGEMNAALPEKVLAFAEQETDTDTKKRIFAIYASIIDQLDSAEKVVQALLKDEKAREHVDLSEVRTGMAQRAAAILESCIDQVNRGTIGKEELYSLQKTQKEAVIFATTFKIYAKYAKDIQFSDFIGLDVQTIHFEGTEDAQQRNMFSQMRAIVQENWSKQVPEVAAKVVQGFDGYQVSSATFSVLKKDTEVIGFIGFSPIEGKPRELSAHSFNVDPHYRGSSIGEALGIATLKEKAEKHILHATAHPSIPIGTRYVEDIGFSFDGVIRNYQGTGVDFYSMVANKEENTHSFARTLSTEELIARAGTGEHNGVTVIACVQGAHGTWEDAVDIVEAMTKRGYHVVRHIHPGKDYSKRIFAFEKPSYVTSESVPSPADVTAPPGSVVVAPSEAAFQ